MAAACSYEIYLPSIGYGSRILAKDIRLTLLPGECILLAGANGCGKTTLLRTIEAGNRGAIRKQLPLRDVSTPGRAKRGSSRRGTAAGAERFSVLYLPTGIPKVKGFTVREFIRTGCYKDSAWNLDSRIRDALETLGISELGDRDLSTLSDGQFQKAILAIALSRRADLLLIDEPTAFLDVPGRRAVLQTLRTLTRERGLSVIFSSHDIVDALDVADRVIGITPSHSFLSSGPDDREAVLDRLFEWR